MAREGISDGQNQVESEIFVTLSEVVTKERVSMEILRRWCTRRDKISLDPRRKAQAQVSKRRSCPQDEHDKVDLNIAGLSLSGMDKETKNRWSLEGVKLQDARVKETSSRCTVTWVDDSDCLFRSSSPVTAALNSIGLQSRSIVHDSLESKNRSYENGD